MAAGGLARQNGPLQAVEGVESPPEILSEPLHVAPARTDAAAAVTILFFKRWDPQPLEHWSTEWVHPGAHAPTRGIPAIRGDDVLEDAAIGALHLFDSVRFRSITHWTLASDFASELFADCESALQSARPIRHQPTRETHNEWHGVRRGRD